MKYPDIVFTPIEDLTSLFYENNYEGHIAFHLAHDEKDAGQAIIKEAVDSNEEFTLRVTDQKGGIHYFKGDKDSILN